jgi:hypothetical protein
MLPFSCFFKATNDGNAQQVAAQGEVEIRLMFTSRNARSGNGEQRAAKGD